MRFTGEQTLRASVEEVWDALLDPAVLLRSIPGCERLETTGKNCWDMTVTAGVAAVRGTYSGSCELTDLVPHESLVMRVQGAGAPGTVDATVRVRFTRESDAATTVSYDADAVVGGMVGGVGQRMLASVSRRMAGEFFGNVEAQLAGVAGTVPMTPAEPDRAAMPGVYTAPATTGPVSRDFLAGVAVGAGLVVLGVLLGRRR